MKKAVAGLGILISIFLVFSRDDLGIPENISLNPVDSDSQSHAYIWNRLRDDVEFNIQVETLNILASADEVVGHTDFESFSEQQIKNTLSRYNGKLQSLDGTVNSRVQTYGNQVYQLYQAFLQNS